MLRSCLNPKVWYTLHITTSDIRGAGTDADVHIALTGSQGSSGVVDLTSRPQQYQRGQTDKFRYATGALFGLEAAWCNSMASAGHALQQEP